MTKVFALLLMIITVSAQAALPTFLGTWGNCPPGNPYCNVNQNKGPPPVQLNPNAPQACAPTDTTCIQTYSQTQTQNYQSGVTNPSFVSPVLGGGSCILSNQSQCTPTQNNWQSNTVTPITGMQQPYDVGNRPEFQQQNCTSVYSPFSRTTTQQCTQQ